MSETGTVNKHELINLIILAKGERTTAEFAAICNTSPSSLSKITNGHFQRPLNINLLRAVAEAADPNSGVTLEKLMEANGRVTSTDNTRILGDRKFQIEKDMAVTISHTLLTQFDLVGMLEKNLDFLKVRDKSSHMLDSPNAFYQVRKDGSIQDIFWAFVFFTTLDSGLDVSTSRERINNVITNYFLAESWHPEAFDNLRVSFVFCSAKAYNEFSEMYKNSPVSHYFSFILVDCASKEVNARTVIGNSTDTDDMFYPENQ